MRPQCKLILFRLTALSYFWLAYAIVLNWPAPSCTVDQSIQFKVDRDHKQDVHRQTFLVKRHIPLVKKVLVESFDSVPVMWRFDLSAGTGFPPSHQVLTPIIPCRIDISPRGPPTS